MIYQIFAISLIIVEGILILISFRSLKDIQVVSKDFAAIFGKAKEEISFLFKELKELIALSIKRENHMLYTTFHLEEVEMYVKMILEKLEQEKDTK